MVVYLPVSFMSFFPTVRNFRPFCLTSASARQAGDKFHVTQDVDLSNCRNLFLSFGGQQKKEESSMHTTHEH